LREHAVVGETPNLAARLQALAEPGTIVVAASTCRLLGNLFRLRDLGWHEVRGIAEPAAAWAVEGVSDSESRFEGVRAALTDFIGREDELDSAAVCSRRHGAHARLGGEIAAGAAVILDDEAMVKPPGE
jgi:Adenylate and Guanylate cyclase catalytic domain